MKSKSPHTVMKDDYLYCLVCKQKRKITPPMFVADFIAELSLFTFKHISCALPPDKQYVPYGEEWEKEVKKFTKKELVNWLRIMLIKSKE